MGRGKRGRDLKGGGRRERKRERGSGKKGGREGKRNEGWKK